MQMNNNYHSFKERLDNNHEWPSLYMFKFIVPSEKEEEVNQLFPKNELSSKFSKGGKYISVTAKIMMNSSEDIMKIYEEAHKIDGVIAL